MAGLNRSVLFVRSKSYILGKIYARICARKVIKRDDIDEIKNGAEGGIIFR